MSTITKYVNDIVFSTTISALDCAACGITFGISAEFEARRRSDHRDFYCPNGHNLAYNGPSKAERERDAARELAARESRRRQYAEQRAQQASDEAERERRSAAAYKGHATRIRNRIKNGVCPVAGCKRHFTNVRRHIATQHPDFVVPAAVEGAEA